METELKINKPIQICVKRRAAIGDVIMTTGIARELKKLYGDSADVIMATDIPDLFQGNPHIKGVCNFDDAKKMEFDVVYNLDGAYEVNPENNYVDTMYHRVFGHLDMDRSVELFTLQEEMDAVDADLKDIGDKFIIVHMRNWNWVAKNIDMSVWFDVYTKLFEQRTDFKIVVVGAAQDFTVEEHPLFVDKRTKYTSQQIKYLCDHASAFVGIDSGPYWCAAASKTHIVSLHTHLKPERILPYRNGAGNNCTAIQTNEDCAGCNDRQPRPVRFIQCEKENYPCVGNFNTQAIADAILKQL